jgi:hypothetical protein
VDTVNWKSFRELHAAVNTAGQTITTDKLSEADKAKAWSSLTGTLKSLSRRGVKELETKREALSFTQLRELELLSQRSEFLLQLCDILARDLEATATLLKRGGK